MSEKECVLTKGSQINDACINRDQLFHSTSAASCSSNGSSSTTAASGTAASSGSSSSLEYCSSTDLQVAGVSSPLALHCTADSCVLQPPLKLQSEKSKLLPLLIKLPPINIKPPSSAPQSKYPRNVEHDNGAVKRSMGLMKLRRQGSHPPASNKSCHGSFNQAAAARELMASLERLSMKDKTMGMTEEGEREAQRALLAGDQSEEGLNAESGRQGMKTELPLTVKIAAAMDAEGLIGVQEEITKYTSRELRGDVTDQYNSPRPPFIKSRQPPSSSTTLAAAAGSGDHHELARSATVHKMHSKRRRRWIIHLRRLRTTRSLLGKIWIKFKRVFSSSSRKHLQNKLLKVNT